MKTSEFLKKMAENLRTEGYTVEIGFISEVSSTILPCVVIQPVMRRFDSSTIPQTDDETRIQIEVFYIDMSIAGDDKILEYIDSSEDLLEKINGIQELKKLILWRDESAIEYSSDPESSTWVSRITLNLNSE